MPRYLFRFGSLTSFRPSIIRRLTQSSSRRAGAESELDIRKANYIPTLDGWRGIAISCVLLCHSLHWYTAPESLAGLHRIVNDSFARLGTFGVALFFAISGFLICSLLLIEREKKGRISLSSFYIRRAFRILPPALTYLLFLALLASISLIRLRRGELASAAFFYSNYWPAKSWYTTHFWSLSTEEHFYFIWPGLLAFLGNSRAAICAVGVLILTPLLRPLALDGLSGYAISRALEKTPMRLESFMIACLLAIFLRDRRIRERFVSFFRAPVWLLLAIVLGGVILLTPRLTSVHIDARSLQAWLLALLVAGTTLHPRDFIGRLLEWSPLKFLGRISYSVYLWQQFFLRPETHSALSDRIMWLFPKVALVLCVATLSYYWIEQPCIHLGRRLIGMKLNRTRTAQAKPRMLSEASTTLGAEPQSPA